MFSKVAEDHPRNIWWSEGGVQFVTKVKGVQHVARDIRDDNGGRQPCAILMCSLTDPRGLPLAERDTT